MSLAFNGTSSKLTVSAPLLTAFPCAIFCWIKPTANNIPNTAISVTDATSNEGLAVRIKDNSGDPSHMLGVTVAFSSTEVVQSNGVQTTYQPCLVVFKSAVLYDMWYGANARTQHLSGTNNVSFGLLDKFSIGVAGSADTNWWNGEISEVAIWQGFTPNTDLVQADWDSLKAGALPETIAPTFLVDSWSLKTQGATQVGTKGTVLTAANTTQGGTHPITRTTPTGPTISAHPANQTVTAPATAMFSVTATASGGGTMSYQWQRSINGGGTWASVTTGTGGTTSSYTTAATTVSGGNANNADQWRCVVTEAGGTNDGSANSNAATLTVNSGAAGPTINTQPTSSTVTAPATATFTVAATASAGSLAYQWQRSINGGGTWASVTTGTGGTTSSYTTAATTVSGGNANNADQWRCAVTDANGTTNSSAATLTVNAALAGLTSSPLKSNAGVLHLSAAFEAFVLNATSGALVVRKTGLVSHATTGVVAFTDATLAAATQYRVVWRRTDTGAQGIELLTAA